MAECLTKKRNYCVNKIYSRPVITTTSGVICLLSARDYHFIPNPPEYTDPDGKTINIDFTDDITQSERNSFNAEIEKIKSSDTEAGKRYRDIEESKDITVNIKVTKEGKIQIEEQRATAVENQYRAKMEPGLGRNQRDTYSFRDNRIIDIPRYSTRTESWSLNGKPWNLRQPKT